MVIAGGMAIQRVLKPIIIKIGHTNSPITVRNNEGVAPIPIGSPNSKLPLINFWNLGIPCVNNSIEGTILSSAKPMLVLRLFFIRVKFEAFKSTKFLINQKVGLKLI